MSDAPLSLIVCLPGEEPVVHSLQGDSISLGRSPENDIQVLVSEVSVRHGSFVKGDEGYRLFDPGSTNGTLVNGVRIGPEGVALKAMDRLILGTVVPAYVVPESLLQASDPKALIASIEATAEPPARPKTAPVPVASAPSPAAAPALRSPASLKPAAPAAPGGNSTVRLDQVRPGAPAVRPAASPAAPRTPLAPPPGAPPSPAPAAPKVPSAVPRPLAPPAAPPKAAPGSVTVPLKRVAPAKPTIPLPKAPPKPGS